MVRPLLVGGFNPSEKYWAVRIIIPNMWKYYHWLTINYYHYHWLMIIYHH